MYQEYINQANVLLDSGEPEKAIMYYEKAEKLEPNHEEIYLGKGIAYAGMEKLDEAEKTFKKALLVNKKCGEAYFHIGCMEGLKGNYAQAVKNLDMAILNGYDNAQTYLTLGMLYEEQKNINMALRNYNKGLLLEPSDVDLQIQKCSLLVQETRREEALEALSHMIKHCPDYFEGYHMKCKVLSELSRYDEAMAVLNEGIEMFPKELGFEVDKAKMLVTQNKLNEAQKILEEVEKKDDGEWLREILLEQVRVAGLQENVEKTEALLKRALQECRINGDMDEEIAYLLMSVYMAQNKADEIIEIAKEIIKHNRNNMYSNVAHFYYAEALYKQGRNEDANIAYENTIKKCRAVSLANPRAVDSYMIRALSMHRLGKDEESLEMIDYVIDISPETAHLHAAKASVLKDMGREEEMRKEIEIVNRIGGKMSVITSVL